MGKKYLFLLGSYLPYASANGVCVEKIALSLKNHDNDVFCLSMKRYDDASFEEIDGIKVYRINNLWHNRVFDWCDLHSDLFCVNLYRKATLWLWRFKRIALFFLWPLSSPIFAYNYYRKSKQICEDNKIDCVIAVYQPFESLFALYLLKKIFPQIITVAYFFDCFYGGAHMRTLPYKWTQRRSLFCERKILPSCNLILNMPFVINNYTNKEIGEKTNIATVDIPLLVKTYETSISKNKQLLTMVYAGSLNAQIRNPTYAVSICRHLPLKGALVFYGNTDSLCYFEGSVPTNENFIIKHGGKLTYAEIKKRVLSSDILINISNRNTVQIPSKIFEYMSTGKPIITFYSDSNDPSLPYLKKYPLSLIIQENWDKLEENAIVISDFINDTREKRVPFSTVENLFPENTPGFTVQKLLLLVNSEKSNG